MEADDASDAGDNVSDVVPSPDPPPLKPKTFPTCDVPGWTVSKLPKAKKTKEDGQVVWKWFFFNNSTTGESRWTPPPPADDEDSSGIVDLVSGLSCVARAQSSGGIEYFMSPGPRLSVDEELEGEEPPPPVDKQAQEGAAEDEDPKERVRKSTWDPTKVRKPELIKRAEEDNISFDRKDKRADIEKAVNLHFMELHRDLNTGGLYTGYCYQPIAHSSDKIRKENCNKRKVRSFAEQAVEKGAIRDVTKRDRKKKLTPEEAINMFHGEGLYTIEHKTLRCLCNKKIRVNTEASALKYHFKKSVHTKAKEKRHAEGVAQALLISRAAANDKARRLEYVGTRVSNVSQMDIEVQKDMTKVMLGIGIPSTKLTKASNILEKHMKRSIGNPHHYNSLYATEMIAEEKSILETELSGITCSSISDATPRQGDFFALLLRFVQTNDKNRTASAVQRLVYMTNMNGSLNADTFAAAHTNGIQSQKLRNSDVPVAINDGCYTNGAGHDLLAKETDFLKEVPRFVAICLSHCSNNAGNQASFVILDLFWSIVQKVFCQSEQARDEWVTTTGISYPTHSETRWYSKYEWYEVVLPVFPDLITVARNLIKKKISPANSGKLYAMMTEPGTSWYLKIQLSAYVEGLVDFRDACYFLEGDATDLPFMVWRRFKKIEEAYPDGQMKTLPSTERLIMEAIGWATNEGGFTAPDPTAPCEIPRNTAAVQQEAIVGLELRRLRQTAVVTGVERAVQAVAKTPEQRRELDDQELLEAARVAAEEEEVQIAALVTEARAQGQSPPLTPDAWRAHVASGIAPAVEYWNERINNQDGDRYKLAQLFRGVSVFDPTHAKTLSRREGMDALEKLRHFPILDTDDDNIVNCLKDTWSAYQRIISTFVGEMNKGPGKKDGGDWNDILTYHYRLYLKLKDEVDGGITKVRCQHCGKVSDSCFCNEKLMYWWKAAALVALVQPSSGAAERVFSLLKNLFGQKQTRLLSETIYLALFLAFNGRV